MRKNIFTAGRNKKKLTKLPRKGSDENVSKGTYYSTNPKDLPAGFKVGSMSVAYVPPHEQAEEDVLKKGKKHRKAKDRSESPLLAHPQEGKASPLVSHRIAMVASKTTKLDSNERHDLSKEIKVNIASLEESGSKRSSWAVKGRLQRSCSMDALDKMGDIDDDGKQDEKLISEVPLRRFSTEAEGATASYAHPVKRQGVTEALSNRRARRPNSSFHGVTAHSTKPPLPLHTFISQVDSPLTRSDPQRILHEPKSVEHLMEALQSPKVDVNKIDEISGNAPIHSIITNTKKKRDRIDLLLALLMNSRADIDLQNRRSMTALHLAIEVRCDMCIKAAIVFGADINKQGCNQFTPLDLVISDGTLPTIETILLELGAKSSTQKMAECREDKKVPRLYSFAQKIKPPKRVKKRVNANEVANQRGVKELYNELETSIIRRMSISATIGGADAALALVMQQRELALYNRTQPKPKKNFGTGFGIRGGSRMLFLDGGGIKGLSQLQVLMELEKRTQSKITDLFDWIVGTSTGAVIALALVYGKKTLVELRQLYFLMKNRIFQKSRYGYGYNSETLEEILKEYLTEKIRMSDITHPKVLIAAVNKETTNLELHFFNNCFNDEYSHELVWKVARYTSAAPMFFNEFENYVDGGVICNNPTDYGLTAIQNFCRQTNNNIPIAAVVSVGTGVYPASKMGNVDAQEALFFGKQWLKPGKLIKQTQSLLSLLSNALLESEMVAKNSQSRCKEQDIPFFRFSAKFDEVIASGETDSEKLFNMIIRTMQDLRAQQKEVDELINIFQAVAENSQDLSQEPEKEEAVVSERSVSEQIQEEEEEEEEEEEGRKEPIKRRGQVQTKEKETVLSPRESVKMKLEKISTSSSGLGRVSTASSEVQKDVASVPHDEVGSLHDDSVFKDANEEEDSQPAENVSEDNDSLHQQLRKEEFSGSFLFDSINGALKKRMSVGQKIDIEPLSDSPSPTNSAPTGSPSPASTETAAATNWALHQHQPMRSQPQAEHRSNALPSQGSAPNLYKPYRTDTNQVDESQDEYTSYQRQTLV